jgi:hypothetical protein
MQSSGVRVDASYSGGSAEIGVKGEGLELICARNVYGSLLRLKEKFDPKIDLAEARSGRGG